MAAAYLTTLALGHASMSLPPPRGMHGKPIECVEKKGYKWCDAGCTEQNCLWYAVGCMVGCDSCSLEGKEMWPTPAHVSCKRNGTAVPPGKTPFPVPRTVPAAARTWNIETKSPAGDFTAYMPWSSPGASPVVDPCGVASGFGSGAPKYVHAPKGYKVGDLGSAVLKPLPGNKTIVKAGGTLEAAFGFQVNHGGGYQYRLCPSNSNAKLTEECFQMHPLDFATANHTIRWVDGSKKEIVIPAMTITEGTTPKGSEWRRIPFPACNCDLGENCYFKEGDDAVEEVEKKKGGAESAYEQQPNAPKRCPTGTQFPVPAEDLYGYGDVPPVLVVDTLKVPAHFEEGDYVLSWRWDCEQTPQIWNTCADVTVAR